MSEKKEPKKIVEKFGFVGGDLLQSILDKSPSSIVDEERAILQGRISYLSDDQIKNFGLSKKGKKAEVVEEVVPEEPKEEEKEIVEKPVKKPKKVKK